MNAGWMNLETEENLGCDVYKSGHIVLVMLQCQRVVHKSEGEWSDVFIGATAVPFQLHWGYIRLPSADI